MTELCFMDVSLVRNVKLYPLHVQLGETTTHQCLTSHFTDHLTVYSKTLSRPTVRKPNLYITSLLARNPPVTDEFPLQRASQGENFPRHDTKRILK